MGLWLMTEFIAHLELTTTDAIILTLSLSMYAEQITAAYAVFSEFAISSRVR
jgi:hypothetical protein